VSAGGRGRRRAKHHEEEEHENHERWLVSYADMLTLLFCLFVVLFAMSQIDKAKFAQLASGLAHSFGTPINAMEGSSGATSSVLDGLPNPVDIAAGVGETKTSAGVSQKQVDAAAAQAALQRAQNVQAEAKDAYDQLAAARAAIDSALAKAGYAGAATYTIDQRGLVVHVIADKVLFDSAKADLRPEGARLLDSVVPTLQALPNQVRVEGHANSQPVDPKGPWPSNWELSAYRATTVLRHLSADGVPDGRMSAAGYSSTQPLVPDTDPTAVTVNRRVDIVVLSTASPEANDQLAALDAGTQKGPR
jgi:chemotaxis protein MotB